MRISRFLAGVGLAALLGAAATIADAQDDKPLKIGVLSDLSSVYSDIGGLGNIEAAHPDIDIYTAAIDDHLNENGYILPGLGDAGDKIFGTKQLPSND